MRLAASVLKQSPLWSLMDEIDQSDALDYCRNMFRRAKTRRPLPLNKAKAIIQKMRGVK